MKINAAISIVIMPSGRMYTAVAMCDLRYVFVAKKSYALTNQHQPAVYMWAASVLALTMTCQPLPLPDLRNATGRQKTRYSIRLIR
jgi:hypothetical protein